MPLVALLALPAVAQDDGPEIWAGAAVSGGGYASRAGLAATDPTTTQVELDGALGWGWGHVRVDLDGHFDLNVLADGGEGQVLAYPSPWPEWAMVQLGRDAVHARLGVYNPNIGLEDWDVWNNYAPLYSTNFVQAGAGRFAGAEASYTTAGGVDLFAFGGYDLDWESAGAGVGVATEQDAFGTWSGLTIYPSFAGDYCPDAVACFNGFASLALEVYPLDPLWVTLDSVTGVKAGGFYTSEQLVLNIAPQAVVNPFVRGEIVLDPEGVLGAPDAAASLGVRSDPTDLLRIALEGRSTFTDGARDLGVAMVIALHVPEPSPYSYRDPFGEEE